MKHIASILSLCFAATVFCFWGFFYTGHLSFHEEFQLFLYDMDYWLERVSVPGGMSDYLAEYLTQFYFHPWMGALILAGVLTSIQLVTWWQMHRQGCSLNYYALSFVPACLLWGFLCSDNALLSLPVALLITLLISNCYPTTASVYGKMGFILFALPAVYWLAGPVGFALSGWVLLSEIKREASNRNWLNASIFALFIGVFTLICPLLAAQLPSVQYTWEHLFKGINYYRHPLTDSDLPLMIAATSACLPFLSALLPALKKSQNRYIVFATTAVVCCLAGYLWIKPNCNLIIEEALEYDRLARFARWEEIIRKAEKESYRSPVCATYLNLALCKRGELNERMLHFPQFDTQGMLKSWVSSFATDIPYSEVYYHLGLINTAQRFTVEVMEAIPNGRKSSRCYKRLAEISLINGHYNLARKYLSALRKSRFYKRYAENLLTYVGDEERINRHPEWGQLRSVRPKKDFLFNAEEPDKTLEALLTENPMNRMAQEYLLAYKLLSRNLQGFTDYFTAGNELGFGMLPRHIQEALLFLWSQEHASLGENPWNVSPEVVRELTDFASIFTSQHPSRNTLLRTRYGDTFWYYLMCQRPLQADVYTQQPQSH